MSCFLDSWMLRPDLAMRSSLRCWSCHFLLFIIVELSLPSMTNKYSAFCLPVINMPTISPFGIDGNPLKNIQLYHYSILEITSSILEITTLSPPLTSMSKKKHATPELLQCILPLSTMSSLEIQQILNKYSP
jgi:hypothetical protein